MSRPGLTFSHVGFFVHDIARIQPSKVDPAQQCCDQGIGLSSHGRCKAGNGCKVKRFWQQTGGAHMKSAAEPPAIKQIPPVAEKPQLWRH